jgi:hypothetical protein
LSQFFEAAWRHAVAGARVRLAHGVSRSLLMRSWGLLSRCRRIQKPIKRALAKTWLVAGQRIAGPDDGTKNRHLCPASLNIYDQANPCLLWLNPNPIEPRGGSARVS